MFQKRLRNALCVTGMEAGAAFISNPSVSVGPQFTDGHATFMIPVLARVLAQQQPSSSPTLAERVPGEGLQEQKAKGGSVDSAASLVELLDGLVLFYHVSAHKQLAKVQFIDYLTSYNTTYMYR